MGTVYIVGIPISRSPSGGVVIGVREWILNFQPAKNYKAKSAISHSREKDSRQMAVGSKCGSTDYRTTENKRHLTADLRRLPQTIFSPQRAQRENLFVCRETSTNKNLSIADNNRITLRQDAKGAKFGEYILTADIIAKSIAQSVPSLPR
jgi:hypothetical protein